MSIRAAVGQLEAMEAGLGPWELITGTDREEVLEARLQVVVDGETSMAQASGVVDEEIGTDEPAAAPPTPRNNATERTALAVAATAAVALTNLFFLLRGRTQRRRCGRIEGISTLFLFAAFLSAAGLLIVRNTPAGRNKIVQEVRRRVLLVASAAALFVAAAGTVLSLMVR